jgi:predicted nucleic acid-binding protein
MNNDVSSASRIYADSNTLIYLVEGSPEFLPFAEKLFRYAGEQGIALVTSEITIAECLHGAHKQGSEALAEEYREVFRDMDVFNLVPVAREILERAAKIGAEQKLKLIDAVHVSSAIDAGCDVFVTNDRGIKSTPDLRVVQLSEL